MHDKDSSIILGRVRFINVFSTEALAAKENAMNRLPMTNETILAVASPIIDKLMLASTDIDQEKHFRDFSEKLKAIVTNENIEAQGKHLVEN